MAIYVTVLLGIPKGWNLLCPGHPRRAARECSLHLLPSRERVAETSNPTLRYTFSYGLPVRLNRCVLFLPRLCLRAVHECIYDKVYRRNDARGGCENYNGDTMF